MDFYETLREYVSAREDSVYAASVMRDPAASRAHSDRAIEAFLRLVKIHDDMRVALAVCASMAQFVGDENVKRVLADAAGKK
jgi:hypothetical protein